MWYNGVRYVLNDDDITLFTESLSKPTGHVSQLKGQCAMSGFVKGHVVVIQSTADLTKAVPNMVMVAHTTTVDVMPAVKKAAAIVTDMGGITSHAAIVAREFRIPCVIGTNCATDVLHDGDLVEVNANHGVVTILERKSRP